MKLLSIVVPCYNEEKVLNLFYKEITNVLSQIDIDKEIILIDDGSRDSTLNLMKELSNQDNHIRYISFSRNFGKEAAILAGLTESRGDYIVLIDADLQHPPTKILEMYNRITTENVDMVATRRITRKGEPPIRSFFAKLFYKIINKISQVKIVPGCQDFRIMSREVVNSILKLTEYNRFSKGIFNWIGYNTVYIELENIERAAGETSWSFWGLLKYALEGIVAYTTAPLQVATILGFLTSSIAFIYLLYIIFKTILFGSDISGFPTIVCLILILGGFQLISLGIIGEYLSKTYLETKKRPKYFIKEKN
ncbi:glycosyltransferase family 2 protein [Hathewaya limosa]|uniref:Glycosyltransferase involved in cell wall biosynthesis n=1 Tax=Hathewaya limosa TaxID=1536 RepID=A0ABU0JR27_HATLI|nr:glycosyltransferase family 2 protein [Hathewaya limosa]MDQ0479551.1 glycosyltransferase involved in cell wall biosynthesis [Hathewaya limosa]